jgi:hypothetical protein
MATIKRKLTIDSLSIDTITLRLVFAAVVLGGGLVEIVEGIWHNNYPKIIVAFFFAVLGFILTFRLMDDVYDKYNNK